MVERSNLSSDTEFKFGLNCTIINRIIKVHYLIFHLDQLRPELSSYFVG